MIFGKKKDIAKLLPHVSPKLQRALNYIEWTDFANVENGEYELSGRDVFARVNTYETEPKEVRRPEKHNAYIDVQFVARGAERIYYKSLDETCVETENKAEKEDVIFYADPNEGNNVVLEAGDFAIFFPWELHRPNCHAADAANEVQKVVVKVKA